MGPEASVDDRVVRAECGRAYASLYEAMQYRQATCNVHVSVNAEAILTKSCVVEGFVGQMPNSDSNVPKIFLIFS